MAPVALHLPAVLESHTIASVRADLCDDTAPVPSFGPHVLHPDTRSYRELWKVTRVLIVPLFRAPAARLTAILLCRARLAARRALLSLGPGLLTTLTWGPRRW